MKTNLTSPWQHFESKPSNFKVGDKVFVQFGYCLHSGAENIVDKELTVVDVKQKEDGCQAISISDGVKTETGLFGGRFALVKTMTNLEHGDIIYCVDARGANKSLKYGNAYTFDAYSADKEALSILGNRSGFLVKRFSVTPPPAKVDNRKRNTKGKFVKAEKPHNLPYATAFCTFQDALMDFNLAVNRLMQDKSEANRAIYEHSRLKVVILFNDTLTKLQKANIKP